MQPYNKPDVGSYNDNFVLDLRYYSSDYSLIYTKCIPLTSTQDKGDEEILEAIQFYYNLGNPLPEQENTNL
jgi:hypothetical protein